MENKPDAPVKTTFGWDLCHTCNYRCAYCRGWERQSAGDVTLPPERWLEIWGRIRELYGECHIFVSGGEPSTYPGFGGLMLGLAKLHEVDICTNFSWDPAPLAAALPPGRLTISPTFHADFAEFEDFFAKAVKYKDYLPSRQVYTVAQKTSVPLLPEWSRRFAEHGVKLVPIPLRGGEEMLNDKKEEKTIDEVSPYSGEKKLGYQLKRLSPKGKLCSAGQRYAVIRSDCRVDRCSQTCDGEVGSILEPDFRLFDAPRPCRKDYCPIESQWIIEE
ncbi:MAG: radical SAM protein [Elusimicrobiales bacterium]|nr:radical SAM protein [Elusimicrobiales bacterium]